MNIDGRTKHMLANAVIKLSETMPLEDVTVTDITNACGMSRNSFYYHFKDKQDLIWWIYSNFHDTELDLTPKTVQEDCVNIFSFMRKHADFFKQAFKDTRQNNFRDAYYGTGCDDYIRMIDMHLDENHEHLPKWEKVFLARYFSLAGTAITIEHLEQGTEDTDAYVMEIIGMIWKYGLFGVVDKLVEQHKERSHKGDQ